MPPLASVGGRVPVRRRVAATDLAAGHAHAEVDPAASDLQAFLAAFEHELDVAGLQVESWWTDEAHDFAVVLAPPTIT
jgi:uncharacterized SAM-dependent methyltransferase